MYKNEGIEGYSWFVATVNHFKDRNSRNATGLTEALVFCRLVIPPLDIKIYNNLHSQTNFLCWFCILDLSSIVPVLNSVYIYSIHLLYPQHNTAVHDSPFFFTWNFIYP